MSLLTMMTQVCRRMGITAPTSVSASSDPQILQLMAIGNEEGQDLSARYPWQALINESTFTTLRRNRRARSPRSPGRTSATS
jgi:hypothetical protein